MIFCSFPGSVSPEKFYGVGNESSAINNVFCQGTENEITECMYTNITAPGNCSDVDLFCRGKQKSAIWIL